MSPLTDHLDQLDTDVRYFAAWADEALIENMRAITDALREIDGRVTQAFADGRPAVPLLAWDDLRHDLRRILDRITGSGDAPPA